MHYEIKSAALQFRLAIEGTEKESLSAGLRRFPWGACGDASLLLARYLQDRGFGPCVILRSEQPSHIWLRSGDLIIDITADQFAGFDSGLFVGDEDTHMRLAALTTSASQEGCFPDELLWDYARLRSKADEIIV